jgi:hypothetical protein
MTLPYEPPRASVLGSITQLTASKSGHESDFMSSEPPTLGFPSKLDIPR